MVCLQTLISVGIQSLTVLSVYELTLPIYLNLKCFSSVCRVSTFVDLLTVIAHIF